MTDDFAASIEPLMDEQDALMRRIQDVEAQDAALRFWQWRRRRELRTALRDALAVFDSRQRRICELYENRHRDEILREVRR